MSTTHLDAEESYCQCSPPYYIASLKAKIMLKLILSFIIILFGLLLGYGIQVLVNRNAISLPIPLIS